MINNASITTSGLIFNFDEKNIKCWKGKPTINYATNAEPRIDPTYIPWSATSSGSWNAKHPEAITVFNNAGNNISSYINTGVTNWTNTFHAVWCYDDILKKPVVIMKDYDGQWKAKSFSIANSFNGMGLTYGDTFSISWLQWTDSIQKTASSGLYGLNTSGVNGFHSGQSQSQSSAYNTTPNKWQRVYATFTVSTSWNLSANLNIYMYGQSVSPRGVLKIADVQIEAGIVSPYVLNSRTNNDCLRNSIDNQTLSLVDLSYTSQNEILFDGVNDEFEIPNFNYPSSWTDPFTIDAWIQIDSSGPWQDTSSGSNSGTGIIGRGSYSTSHGLIRVNPSNINFFMCTAGATYQVVSTNNLADTWYNFICAYDGNTMRLYRNGILVGQTVITNKSGAPGNTNWKVGGGLAFGGNSGKWGKGRYPVIKIYNRALTQNEVINNYNFLKGRYT